MMTRKIKLLILTLLAYGAVATNIYAQENETARKENEIERKDEDTKRPGLIKRVIDSFSSYDTTYVEPNRYNFSAMVQASYFHDRYALRGHNKANDTNQELTFAPDGTLKFGPYFGWRWVFAGYMFSLNHSRLSDNKTEFDFSLYSSRFGIDLYYRRTGSDNKLRTAEFDDIDIEEMEDKSFDGLQSGMTGFDAYYIFNYKHFSYPAAFAQSTVQKKSCGSWMAGAGYKKVTLDFDNDKMQSMFDSELGAGVVKLDSSLMFHSLRYHEISLSTGYAYNWVFAPRWLMSVCAQAGIGYKVSLGEVMGDTRRLHFSFTDLYPNMTGRFGVIYNTGRWFTGMSAIVHSNNYRKERFWTNNTFGSINVYVGYNFALKKEYKRKK